MRNRFAAIAAIALLAGTVLTACAAKATTTPIPGVLTVEVVLTDATVTSSQATFRPGVHCRFVVTNRGTRPHQFWLMPQGMGQMMSRMPMALWHRELLYGTQDIGPGMMTTFDYTFTRPMEQRQLAFGCYSADGRDVVEMPIRVSP